MSKHEAGPDQLAIFTETIPEEPVNFDQRVDAIKKAIVEAVELHPYTPENRISQAHADIGFTYTDNNQSPNDNNNRSKHSEKQQPTGRSRKARIEDHSPHGAGVLLEEQRVTNEIGLKQLRSVLAETRAAEDSANMLAGDKHAQIYANALARLHADRQAKKQAS